MRIIEAALITLISCFAFTLTANQNSNQSPAHDLVVRLVPEKTEFSAGEPISVRIEVSNVGDAPLLLGSFISRSNNGTPVSRIEFELKDNQGHAVTPSVEIISDSFADKKEPNPTTAFLRNYLLLYPGYSLTTSASIDEKLFKELTKPGFYRLSATYTSNGLSYPPVYRQAGLSDDEVKSVPFTAWSGKISTNEVRFRIRPSHIDPPVARP
jgi:hypothetical protein